MFRMGWHRKGCGWSGQSSLDGRQLCCGPDVPFPCGGRRRPRTCCPVTFVRAVVLAVAAGLVLAPPALAQWPTTCVALNDIVEQHLGNDQNVGIYQRVFGERAEEGCQNDHREDVRGVFTWAFDDSAPTTDPDLPPLAWPTTCVALNDIVEAHLGNDQNVGIYQRVFGDQAEAGCRSDHREDVRVVFAWAFVLPGLVVAAVSPTEIDITWSLGADDVTGLALYRDGDLLLNPSVEVRTFRDSERRPNTRYTYRLVARQHDGTQTADERTVATLAYRPKTSDQMATTWTGLQQPIVDLRNPEYTEYRVSLQRSDGHTAVSDWSTSKCRTFDNLKPESLYRITVIARNLDGIETEAASERAGEHGRDFFPEHVYTRMYPGTEDPWVVDRIRAAAEIHGLTGAAVDWMTNDIKIDWRRGEPGWAGHIYGYAGIGHSFLGALTHEVMHAFWQAWDGFPEPCDRMNFYTFRRDAGRFVLEFQGYEQTGSPNPLEPWRLYYNMMLGLLSREPLEGESFWQVLHRGEYGKLLGFYHILETSMPGHAPRHPVLIPPSLRRYLHGFAADGEYRTWEEEIDWYTRLADEDRWLWDLFFISHEVAHYSPHAHAPESAERTRIAEPLRTSLLRTDRQLLVDFINTLEDQKPWEWRGESPQFWSFFVRSHIYRIPRYSSDLVPSAGLTLTEANRDAVVTVLQALNELHCAPGHRGCGYNPDYRSHRSAEEIRNIISNIQGLTEVQRRVLAEMVDLGAV